MPPQKNTGTRGSQRVTPTTKKNNSFFDDYLSDVRTSGIVKDVYVARVIRNVGNGRVDTFYIGTDGAHTEKAFIRGLFRRRGKYSVNIVENSVVLIADNGISGSAKFEVMCLLSPVQIRDLRKVVDLDPRILNFDTLDATELMEGKVVEAAGFEFDIGEDEKDDDEVDVDDI